MAAEVSDSMETSEESETAGGAESMLFILLVVANICFDDDGDKKANEFDGSTKRLAVAAKNVTGNNVVVFIMMRGWITTSLLLPTPITNDTAAPGMRILIDVLHAIYLSTCVFWRRWILDSVREGGCNLQIETRIHESIEVRSWSDLLIALQMHLIFACAEDMSFPTIRVEYNV